MVIFAIMGAAVALFLISVVIYLLWRRRRRQKGRSLYWRGEEPAIVQAQTRDNEDEQKASTSDPVVEPIKETVEEPKVEIEHKHQQTDEQKPPTPPPTPEPVVLVPEPVPVEDKNLQTDSVATSDEGVQANIELPEEKKVAVVEEVVVKSEASKAVESAPPTAADDDDEEEAKPVKKLERKRSRDDITFTSGWRKVVKLRDLISANLIREETIIELETEEVTVEEVQEQLKEYLIGLHPIAGVYNDRQEQKMSLFDAYKAKIISRGTALSLLEAQAATGSIIDPISGDMMGVGDALERQLLDRSFAAVLSRAERAVTGYQVRGTTEVMSLFQAMQSGYIVEKHGIRLLEAQIATGGIIDPVANHRLPVEVAFDRGLFDQRLNKILQDPSDDTKGFLDPNTGENLTYLELIERCIEDKETNLLLLPLVKEQETQLYKTRALSPQTLSQRLHSRTNSSSSIVSSKE